MALSPPRRALIGVAAVSVVVAAGLAVSPSSVASSVESLADDPIRFGLVVAGLYLVRPLFAWPTTPLAIVVGYGFGVAMGVPIALAGVLLTVVPPYLAARWVTADSASGGGAWIPFGGTVAQMSRALDRYYGTTGPVRGVIVSRLVPIPSDVATCAAAASGVSLRHLLAGTLVGELPWTVAAVVLGASAATLTAGELGDVGPLVVVASLVAAAVLLSGPAYRLLTRDSHTPATTTGN